MIETERGNLQGGLKAGEAAMQGFILGVGDEVKVTVWKQDDLNRVLRIDPSGKVFYPLVGEIDAAGLSAEQLRRAITEGLGDYIDNPQVNVDIISFRSRKIYVLGEVKKPGILVIEDSMNIMDALLHSGGPTLKADQKKIILIRSHPDQIELQAIDLKSLFDTGDKSQMVSLQENDIIYVPPSFVANMDRFFEHVAKVIYPIAEIERSILLGDAIWRIFTGKSRQVTVVR
jgi:polysaccharide export outer membrane protein